MDRRSNISEAIEMASMDAAHDNDKNNENNANDNDIFEPTHQTPKSRIDSSRRVRKNYLSMIGVAYILTILSPGTILWSSPSSCNDQFRISNTTIATSSAPITNYSSSSDILANGNTYNDNATSSSSFSTNQNTTQTIIDKCMMYRGGWSSINISVLAKLTCSTLALIVLFLNLQGSNPGLLTNEVMCRLDASENNNATITINNNNGSDHCCDDEITADLNERQSFLEPLPLLHSSSHKATLSTHHQHHQQHHQQQQPQLSNKKLLYPHTRRKYCTTCHIHPPLRSHHCKVCNQCCATFDHHCQFLDTCIGERNHFRFWLFVLLNVVCLTIALGIVGSSSGHAVPREVSSSRLGGESQLLPIHHPIGYAILIGSKLYMYTIYSIASLLWIIHTALALGNCTTFEVTKGSEHVDYLKGTGMMDLPFGRNLFDNARMFFSRDDSMFGWTAFVKGERCCGLGRFLFGRMMLPYCRGYNYTCCENGNRPIKATTTDYWMPILWKMPEFIDRESEDWWNHPWQNKYWSCC